MDAVSSTLPAPMDASPTHSPASEPLSATTMGSTDLDRQNTSMATSPASLHTPAPQTSQREYWTDAEKYDLLWSTILSTGASLASLDWSRIRLPGGHSQQSAAVVLQDIALGKHHITHPTFTPSNTSRGGAVGTSSSIRKQEQEQEQSSAKRTATKKSKKRKLEHDIAEDTDGSLALRTSPESPQRHDHDENDADENDANAEKKKLKPARRPRTKSESPPIMLDLTNPRIRQFLQSEGYMNPDGSPVKRKRGRPTKDPFGLSVTLKKQLLRLDPSAPPMKKRGRPRKMCFGSGGGDAEDSSLASGGDTDREVVVRTISLPLAPSGDANGGDGRVGKKGLGKGEAAHTLISPGLRMAIEKIGEEMDREVEGMLDESRRIKEAPFYDEDEDEEEGEDDEEEEDEEEEEGGSCEDSVAEVWDSDEEDAGRRLVRISGGPPQGWVDDNAAGSSRMPGPVQVPDARMDG
ncbi:hypothetical protein DRE_03005 [Drechslerella stenobrocha 248]|uniref:Uncharacterized protein n=1 Tax=Drechslerella stenobrocha 248 TaxID=1043628 RepID=W7IFB7_9PEZI|nr:hypothetical protein DRE_03005 [Drechslerella stenobrocha 248]